MCGRFTISVELSDLIKYFEIKTGLSQIDYARRYNVAPTQDIPVITARDGERTLSMMRWGLIPHWSRDMSASSKMINARAETVDTKPAFKSSFLHRRCLIPADGFYEWKKEKSGKTPMRIFLPDQEIFAFAGIWAQWKSPGGDEIRSCSIITTAANQYVMNIHDRMPVILSENSQYSTWLGVSEPAVLKELLLPYPGLMSSYPVSSLVNSPRQDNPDLIKEVLV